MWFTAIQNESLRCPMANIGAPKRRHARQQHTGRARLSLRLTLEVGLHRVMVRTVTSNQQLLQHIHWLYNRHNMSSLIGQQYNFSIGLRNAHRIDQLRVNFRPGCAAAANFGDAPHLAVQRNHGR